VRLWWDGANDIIIIGKKFITRIEKSVDVLQVHKNTTRRLIRDHERSPALDAFTVGVKHMYLVTVVVEERVVVQVDMTPVEGIFKIKNTIPMLIFEGRHIDGSPLMNLFASIGKRGHKQMVPER
jgi:hypothetical protein